MLTATELKSRVTGIGGSEAPAALGLSRWTSPFSLYLKKTRQLELGEVEDSQQNAAMYWGSLLEPVVRREYETATGREVKLPGTFMSHPSYPWMLGHVDGIAGDRLVEIKTARSSHEWGDAGTDEIPREYLVQCQHYLAISGLLVCDVAVLIGGSDFRIYEVPADTELQTMIVDGERDFWDHVERRDPPEVLTYEDIRRRWGRYSTPGSVQATSDDRAAVVALRAVRSQLEELTKAEEELKGFVMKALGDNESLFDGEELLATWKMAKGSKTFDVESFRRDHPELYSSYTRTRPGSRRFLLKGVKDE